MSENVHIEAAWKSLNKKNEELCGDRVQIRRNNDGIVMVLADGLGSGVKANILSTLTSTIISEMIFDGMPLSEAVETIVKTLPVCEERGIAYSTFTIIQASYSGHIYIAQYDSPTVVLWRNGSLLQPKKEILEISGKTVEITEYEAKIGDAIITFSDGVLFAGLGMQLNFGWGQDEVEQFLKDSISEKDSAIEISRMLLANVNYLYGGKPGDDSTVACLKVIEAKETRIMVGPPVRAEDDEFVVNRLLSATDKKVCCGGTTSEIVSRVTGKELCVDPELAMAPGVPPKGFIQGIDLVTEGVLTLQYVANMMEKAKGNPTYQEEILASKQKDGATELAKILLQSSSVTFMLGLSDNPAHEDIAYSPISLSEKVKKINTLSEILKDLGKISKVETY